MNTSRETPAGHSRSLHQQVKAFRAEMELAGVSHEAAYMVLMNVVMRLAYEEDGEAGVRALREVVGL